MDAEQTRDPSPGRQEKRAIGSDEQIVEAGTIRPSIPVLRPTLESPTQPGRQVNPAMQGPSAAELDEMGSAWSQPPTVHITIGRIEVRAVPAAQQASVQLPASKRPRLTLDEYLRQRNEGKR